MGFFSKIFKGKDENTDDLSLLDFVEDNLKKLLEYGDFDLSYEISSDDENSFVIELSGEDEKLLKEKDGQLLDAFQLFLKRIIQHQNPENEPHVVVDSSGYREQMNQSLIALAEKLKKIALEKSKPVYIRALSPRDRKVIHKHLTKDGVVKSKSVGEGLYKKIKIFPVQNSSKNNQSESLSDNS